jgi:4-hydroxy-4-methyl-2-oxoglutarate aldolase
MDISAFGKISPCTFCDVITRDRVMDIGIRPVWNDIPRIAGPAYPVRCAPGDNLMLHAAIHRAPAGSVIVVQGGDNDYAQAGGNVCATAQHRGVAGFVIDGVIRDVADTRKIRFPVFARGNIPIPGGKSKKGVLNGSVVCGGVTVEPGDIVVADEEGIVVLPKAQAEDILRKAQAKDAKDEQETLESWMKNHRNRIDKALSELGIAD